MPPPRHHGYGTASYRVAGDTRLIKDVPGRSDVRTTERYTLGHVPEAMRSAMSRLEKHLGASGAPAAAVNPSGRGRKSAQRVGKAAIG